MSHYVAVNELPAGGEKLQTDKLSRIQNLCLLIGGAGLVVSVILLLFGGSGHGSLKQSFGFSWLFAFEVFWTITVGALFWVLLHNASNSGWGVAIRRIPETLTGNFLLLFFLGLPLFIPGLGHRETVWTWIGHHEVAQAAGASTGHLRDQLHHGGHEMHLLYHKFPYLNLGLNGIVPGWDLRYVIYFLILGGIAWKLRQWSLGQDKTGDLKNTFAARRWSCGYLPLLAVCSTFAAVDWVKSLDYKWFSTMFGVNVFAGSALSSMGLIIIIVGTLLKTGHLKGIVSMEHFHIMGKLMHAFIIFWAYIAFSQYFLIWYANIPEETRFYGIRNTGGWRYISMCLTFLHFVLPFVLLLKRSVKKNLNYIMGMAAFVIGVHIMEVYWWILPMRGPLLYDAPSGLGGRFFLDFLMDLTALVTVGALCGYFFFRRLARNSLYPCGDPRLEESVNLHN